MNFKNMLIMSIKNTFRYLGSRMKTGHFRRFIGSTAKTVTNSEFHDETNIIL